MLNQSDEQRTASHISKATYVEVDDIQFLPLAPDSSAVHTTPIGNHVQGKLLYEQQLP